MLYAQLPLTKHELCAKNVNCHPILTFPNCPEMGGSSGLSIPSVTKLGLGETKVPARAHIAGKMQRSRPILLLSS